MVEMKIVQRMSLRRVEEPERGLDGLFSLDYMGSAEYEFGAAFRSLTAIQERGDVQKLSIWTALDYRPFHRGTGRGAHQHREQSVYFVGPRALLDSSIEKFNYWITRGPLRTKEPTYFEENYFDLDPDEYYHPRVDAWWSLTDNFAFALSHEAADKLLAGFRGA